VLFEMFPFLEVPHPLLTVSPSPPRHLTTGWGGGVGTGLAYNHTVEIYYDLADFFLPAW